ncbi:MAG: PocR ligand-binding domain-containing protein [Bacteroidetes bacterium]|nr:PocR ligand-binding domain-containing protein [Bacteroidota bacterium]
MKLINIKTIPWTLLNLFFGIVVSIVLLGFWYSSSIEKQFKNDAKKQVMSIGDLKVQQITSWLNERKADARVLSGNKNNIKNFNDFLKMGKDKTKLLEMFRLYCENYDYASISLIDTSGKIKLSYGGREDSLSQLDALQIQHFIAEPTLEFSELHISVFTEDVTQDLFVPLLEQINDTTELLGIVLIRIDPYRMLYPLIQNWPTESKTGETLLLKKEDSEVVFLNELRHKSNTALKFKLPLNKADAIYHKATNGEEGVFEGEDYRGVQVLASVRKIPGTSWVMVSKIDSEEIDQPLQEQAKIVWIIVILLVVISGITIGIYWRHQRSKYYENLLKLENENKALSKHVEHIVKYANDIIILFDDQLSVIEVNDQACSTYGYTKEEFLKMNASDLRPLRFREELKKIFSEYEDGKGRIYETTHIKKDGTEFPVEVSGRLFKIEIGKYYQTIIRDISERKTAEDALMGLSLRNEALLASVPDIIMEVDNNKIYTWANKAGYDYFGNEVIGKSADYYFEGEQDVYNMVQPLFDGNENIIYVESWQRRHDGEIRLLAWWCRVLKNEEGIAIGALSTARDITIWKQTEEILRTSEGKYRSLVESMTEGMALHEVIYDDKGQAIDYRIEDVNPAFEKHIGIPIEKAKGALASELYGVSYAPFLNEYAKVAESGVPYSFQIYFPPLLKHFEISVFSPEKGWFATVFTDITDKKRMEEAIERRIIALTNPVDSTEDLKFEDLFNLNEIQNIQDAFAKATGVASIITDIEGKPLTKPSQFCDLCENIIRKTEKGLANCIRSDAVLGKTTLDGPNIQHCLSGGLWDGGASIKAGEKHIANWLIGQIYDESADKESMRKYADEIGADKEEFSLALDKVTRMPKEQFENVCDSLFLFAQKLSDMALQNVQQARLITKQKLADEEIRTLNQELEERVIKRTEQLEASNKELEAFSYSVSHDLRSPLRALDGFARILMDEYSTNLDEEGTRLLNVIIDNSQIMGNLIDDLLAFSRISRQEMQSHPIDMFKMVNSVFTELNQFYIGKNIVFNLQEIPNINGDSSMIRQVWINLISNALKFSSTKEEQVIAVGCMVKEDENIYFVKDNGVGFNMEYSNKLFGVFQRLHSMKDFEGTGVGLALVQRIINRHKGRVWGEGKLKEGATFYFSIKDKESQYASDKNS